MNIDSSIKIECKHFDLRIISQDEYKAYFTLVDTNRDRLTRYFPNTVKSVKSPEQAKNHLIKIHKKNQEKGIYPFGIYKNDTLIGWISIKNIDWGIPKCELGYYIDKSYEGKSIISNAVQEIVGYSFENLGIEKIFLRIGANNIGSQKVATRNGFLKEGILRKEFRIENGEVIDLVYYGKLRTEI